MMRLLEYLAEVFIGTFGITQPAADKRKQVAIILGGFILLGLIAGFAIVGFLLYSIHGSH